MKAVQRWSDTLSFTLSLTRSSSFASLCVCGCVGSRVWVVSAVTHTHTFGTPSVRVIWWPNTSMARGSNASESCDLPRNLSDTFDEVVNHTSDRAAHFKFASNCTLLSSGSYKRATKIGDHANISTHIVKAHRFPYWADALFQKPGGFSLVIFRLLLLCTLYNKILAKSITCVIRNILLVISQRDLNLCRNFLQSELKVIRIFLSVSRWYYCHHHICSWTEILVSCSDWLTFTWAS